MAPLTLIALLVLGVLLVGRAFTDPNAPALEAFLDAHADPEDAEPEEPDAALPVPSEEEASTGLPPTG